jgi:hypothetical protein
LITSLPVNIHSLQGTTSRSLIKIEVPADVAS